MKYFLLLVCSLCCVYVVSAQDCKGYYYLLNNAVVEMTIYDAKNNPGGRNVYTITQVHKDGTGTTSDFTSTYYDKDNKVLTNGAGHFKCDGSGVAIDMKVGMPSMPQLKDVSMEGKTAAAFLDYPTVMQAGQELKGGSFEMSGSIKGMDVDFNYAITNRKVKGNEKVTTPAGTWDCVKIGYDLSFMMKMMGAEVPMKLVAEEWFAPGFGVVKTRSFDKSGKPLGSTLITAVKR
ncbi:TapB family protein [Chitinophaga nivalis]|uniref:DUF3108 domain-containing protein n=1 Tax=Chitinophaga nivalis TaxID=2991709 RepID=A0ABT3IEP9_9BACT|nr:hypothetical protein [Chitinophaga nivalis]MCW3467933.1 hypothetical protein [Chitinophaga nivalis]MCW3482376.1 hypothetical protein [Chitinophaga nivalis]